MDQQARVGDRTRIGIFPSVNEQRKKTVENSVKNPRIRTFEPLQIKDVAKGTVD
jgi:hypothetical protein